VVLLKQHEEETLLLLVVGDLALEFLASHELCDDGPNQLRAR
jgi:hypothetical protein